MGELALAYLDRRLSPEGVKLLSQRLKRDRRARREFARLLLQHVQLKEIGPNREASLARLGVPLYRLPSLRRWDGEDGHPWSIP